MKPTAVPGTNADSHPSRIEVRLVARSAHIVAERAGCSFGGGQAESHLTPTLFRQILGRIERLAWHPDVIERTAWLGERRVTRAGVSLKWRGSDGTPVDQARSVVSAPRQHRCDVLGTDRTSSLDVMCFRSAA
jgi:hypothetical protein